MSRAVRPAPLPAVSYSTEAREDGESCRICRGGGSDEEPLFRPCKCSGSIMHVHQDCLMEWLAHSHKKHCELCKTPFRFTKLYHPDMPSDLPTTVFVRRAAFHTLSAALWWGRGFLVALTWLLWLPWTMRFVWWGLFRLADLQWTRDLSIPNNDSHGNSSDSSGLDAAINTDKSSSQAWQAPTLVKLVIWLFQATRPNERLEYWAVGGHQNDTLAFPATPQTRDTILSQVPYLKSLSASSRTNRVVLDVLEGQIITLALVTIIILVLLIREWVVQQQPLINIAEEEDIDRDTAIVPPNAQVEESAHEDHLDSATIFDMEEDDALGELESDIESRDDEGSARSLNSSHGCFRGGLHNDAQDSEINTGLHAQDHTEGTISQRIPSDEPDLTHPEEPQVRPSMPLRETSSIATEIQRRLAEEPLDEVLKPVLQLTGDTAGDDPARMSGSDAAAQNTPEAEHTGQQLPASEGSSSGQTTWSSNEPVSAQRPSSLFAMSMPSSPTGQRSQPRREFWTRPQTKRASRSYEATRKSRRTSLDSSFSIVQTPSSAPSAEIAPDLETPLFEVDLDTSPTQDTNARRQSMFRSDGEESCEAVSKPAFNGEVRQSSLADRDGRVPDSPEPQIPRNEEPPAGHNRSSHQSSPVPKYQANTKGRSIVANVTDWLWGDIGPTRDEQTTPHDDDEQVVRDIANEAPFVPMAQVNPAQAPQDPEVVRAVAEAGIDPQDQEAVEDVEDLEGVMELIGMHGPINGLLTNALFAAVFVACAIVLAVWFPFLTGKAALVAIAQPTSAVEIPLDIATRVVNGVIDGAFFCCVHVLRLILVAASYLLRKDSLSSSWPWASAIIQQAARAANASTSAFVSDSQNALPTTGVVNAEMASGSHASLRYLEGQVHCAFQCLLAGPLKEFVTSDISSTVTQSLKYAAPPKVGLLTKSLKSRALQVTTLAKAIYESTAWSPSSYIDESCAAFHNSSSDEPYWSATDKSVTVAIGYAFFAMLLALYFYNVAPLMRNKKSKELEDAIIEALQQAGGIAKVVLIISIEMLAFPLYCGLLLDVVTLPIFREAGLQGRLDFARDSPWTAIFVHWFVGTCYMFHFALFISMCRKILRKGVLHFIRDPDDPTFHPVRDVLERSVLSQLRRITSSALLYGALLIVCLGSVLWLLAYGMSGLLPIRWTSGLGAFGFPFDLLLYASLEPMVARLLLSNEWLQGVYQWWFKKCARALRLSDYLFGDKSDVESEWRRYLVPGNDQVRVGKRNSPRAWIEVIDERQDALKSSKAADILIALYPEYTVISLPPRFRLRIGLFGAFLWAITAISGLCLTVLPLLFGRLLLNALLPRTITASDICALLVGMGFLSASVHIVLKSRNISFLSPIFTDATRPGVSRGLGAIRSFALSGAYRTLCCLYVYGVVIVVLPSIAALLTELYVISPFHAALSDHSKPYRIHYLQSWTLGIQGLRVLLALVLWNAESRSARGFQAVMERGYSHPKPWLATRYFFLPMVVVALTALLAPALAGWSVGRLLLGNEETYRKQLMLRLAYPATLLSAVVLAVGHWFVKAFRRWRSRIRDDVYLVGVRLISL